MLTLTAEDMQNHFIAHGLKLRAASASGNYRQFFQLYRDAPGHQVHVIETCAGPRAMLAWNRSSPTTPCARGCNPMW